MTGSAGSDTGRTAAEWTTLAISIALLVGIVGLIAWLHLRGAEEPPRIVAEAQLDRLRHEDTGYYLPVEVRNDGDRTVEDVVVEATLDTGGEPETAEITVAFLAGGERVSGTFIFASDPSEGELTVRAISFKDP